MKVGIISDSHGNEENLRLAVRYLIKERKVKTVIHLGDDFEDVEVIQKFPIEIIQVPGVFGSYYQDINIPNRLIKEFEGWKVLITHTLTSHINDLPADLAPEAVIKNKEVQIVLYGHSHIPFIEQKEGIFYLNPGHLQPQDKKGYSPSYAVIEFEKDKVTARIFDLSKNEQILSGEFHG